MLELSSLGVSNAIISSTNANVQISLRSKINIYNRKEQNFSQENIDYTKVSPAYSKDDAKIKLLALMINQSYANIFEPLSKAQINVDMVIQNISSDQTTDITFTVKGNDILKTKEILKNNREIAYKKIIHNDKVAKVSIVGAGMVSTPGVTYKMFRALSDENINILAISTSEIKLSVIIEENNTLKAKKITHNF